MTKILRKYWTSTPHESWASPVHLVPVQQSDVGQGSAVSGRVVVCLKYTRLALSCCVTDLLLDIRCAAVCRRNSAELLGCDESGKQRSPKSVILYILLFRVYVCVRQCTLFRLYVYVVSFPSMHVIPFIRIRCFVSVNVRYSVYTSTLFSFCQCKLFRLYVYVVPFPSMHVIPFIRLLRIPKI